MISWSSAENRRRERGRTTSGRAESRSPISSEESRLTSTQFVSPVHSVFPGQCEPLRQAGSGAPDAGPPALPLFPPVDAGMSWSLRRDHDAGVRGRLEVSDPDAGFAGVCSSISDIDRLSNYCKSDSWQ